MAEIVNDVSNWELIIENKPMEGLSSIAESLENGNILRVEQEGEPVLIRLSRGKHRLIEICRDIRKENKYTQRYWLPYNLSINALLTFDVYEERLDPPTTKNKFRVGDAVVYDVMTSIDGVPAKVKDVAFITQIYFDGETFRYKLSGYDIKAFFKEDELLLYKKVDE